MSLADDLSLPVLKWSHHLGGFLKTGSYNKGLPMEKAYFILIGQLVSYLRGLSSSQPVTGEEGLQSVAVLEAARRSIQTGKVETIA